MKERVLKLLKKNGEKQMVKLIKLQNAEVERNGQENDFNYYKLGNLNIHHNFKTDKIKVFDGEGRFGAWSE